MLLHFFAGDPGDIPCDMWMTCVEKAGKTNLVLTLPVYNCSTSGWSIRTSKLAYRSEKLMVPRKLSFQFLAQAAVLTSCFVSPAALVAQAHKDPRVNRGQLIGIDGKIISRVSFAGRFTDPALKGFLATRTFSDVTATPPEPQPPSSNFLLPDVPKPTPLSTDQVTAILDDLFKWPAASKYGTYFLLLPGAITLKQNVAANVAAIPAGQVYLYQPYPIANKSVAVKVLAVAGLQASWPFQAATGDPADADFVLLDGFAKQVPIPVADSVTANFINGLVTRLILGEYARAWKDGTTISAGDLSFAKYVMTPGFPDMNNASSYPANVKFEADLATLLQNNPVQPAGLLWGWKAGDELDALVGTDDAKYRADVWRLVKSRFTSADMGRMVAFTLSYLTGFIKNERIVSIAASSPQPLDKLNTTQIFDKLSTDTGVDFARLLLSQFHSSLIAEFYALSQNDKLPSEVKQDSLARVAGLIRGFESGSIAAADQVYIDVFQLAYGLGYKDGFRDGYAQGYAAGYRDGYAAGYAQAWKEANVVIQKLQRELDNAKSQNSFWNAVGAVASVVGTVLAFL
jgi:hypothetical protein